MSRFAVDNPSAKSLLVAALFVLFLMAGISTIDTYDRRVINTQHRDIPSARAAFHECLNKHVDGAVTTAEFNTKGTKYTVRCETVRQK